ncbi:MAG: hypothetical protein ABSB61_04165 [Anaerolineales bacterium]
MATWWSIKESDSDRRAESPWFQAGIAAGVILLAGLYFLTSLRLVWLLQTYGWLNRFIHILLIHGA